jgi:hypothetical protein
LKGTVRLYEFFQDSTEQRLRSHYSRFVTQLVGRLVPETLWQVQLVEARIFSNGDEVAISSRNSYVQDCAMTAVAVGLDFSWRLIGGHRLIFPYQKDAIIAQVASIPLSLPFLSQTHWVDGAFFMASLISGALSVYFACLIQRTVFSVALLPSEGWRRACHGELVIKEA